MKTIDAKQAAEFLQLHYNTVILLAQQGKVPCRKVGGKWRFMEAKLADWIAGDYTDGEAPQERTELKIITGGKKWQSTSAGKSGGSISRQQTDDTYSSLLKLKTSSKPKNSTIG